MVNRTSSDRDSALRISYLIDVYLNDLTQENKKELGPVIGKTGLSSCVDQLMAIIINVLARSKGRIKLNKVFSVNYSYAYKRCSAEQTRYLKKLHQSEKATEPKIELTRKNYVSYERAYLYYPTLAIVGHKKRRKLLYLGLNITRFFQIMPKTDEFPYEVDIRDLFHNVVDETEKLSRGRIDHFLTWFIDKMIYLDVPIILDSRRMDRYPGVKQSRVLIAIGNPKMAGIPTINQKNKTKIELQRLTRKDKYYYFGLDDEQLQWLVKQKSQQVRVVKNRRGRVLRYELPEPLKLFNHYFDIVETLIEGVKLSKSKYIFRVQFPTEAQDSVITGSFDISDAQFCYIRTKSGLIPVQNHIYLHPYNPIYGYGTTAGVRDLKYKVLNEERNKHIQ